VHILYMEVPWHATGVRGLHWTLEPSRDGEYIHAVMSVAHHEGTASMIKGTI
jgi:hypothetical protein